MSRALPRLAFFLLATPAVLRSAWRVRRLVRETGLRALPDELRRAAAFRAGWLRRPAWLDGTVARLLPLLPPYRYGPCLKRSLLLLDLWSRCGLEPRLHLGVRRPEESPLAGHAWVTVGDPQLDRRTGPLGHEELWNG